MRMNNKEIIRSVKRECPTAISLLRKVAKRNPYLNERRGDILSPNENLWLLELLGIDAVLNVNGNHTEAVLDLSNQRRNYSFIRFDPNDGLESEQKKHIREDYFYPTPSIMSGYLSSSSQTDKISKRGLAKYLSENYFEENSVKPGTLNILNKLESLNNANDCGPICVYILWVTDQIKNSKSYSITCFENQLEINPTSFEYQSAVPEHEYLMPRVV